MATKVVRFPVSVEDIKNLYVNIYILRQTQQHVFRQFNDILKGLRVPSEFAKIPNDKGLLDLYCQYRPWIIFSEGMNKIWTTVELHKKNIDGELKLDEFNIWFSNSSTIPALHYANISFLLSFITALGLIPLKIRSREVFLVRQKSSYYAIDRKEYIKQRSLKASSENWHEAMIRVSSDLADETGLSLQFDEIDCVRKARNYFDYQILAKDSLFIQAGEIYYGKCLKVSIDLAAKVFNFLNIDLGVTPQNRSDIRFKQLIPFCNEIINNYNSKSTNKGLERDLPCLTGLS